MEFTEIKRGNLPYDDYTDNEIGFSYSLSINGGHFILFADGFDEAQIKEAKNQLKRDRDVVTLRLAQMNDYVEKYRKFLYRHPVCTALKWYQIDETKIGDYYRAYKSIQEYVDEVVSKSALRSATLPPLP